MDILVIEDERLTRKVVDYLLNGQGYSVVTVSSLEETRLNHLTNNSWFVIFDKYLPENNGLGLAKTQTTDPTNSPVILLSCESRLAYRLEGLKVAGDYLGSPFVKEEFMERMQEILREAVAV
jgi:DNA-binding response OmpR family regulator